MTRDQIIWGIIALVGAYAFVYARPDHSYLRGASMIPANERPRNVWTPRRWGRGV